MYSSKFTKTCIAIAAIAFGAQHAWAQAPAGTPQQAPSAPPTQAAAAAPSATNAGNAVAASSTSALPATATQQRQSVTAAEIASINERMAVLSARLAEMELQAKISAKSGEIKRLRGGLEVSDDGYIPSVVDINGVDGSLWATLIMQGGNVQTVRVGDRVGRWTVRAITVDSVAVQSGKDTLRLAFGVYSPAAQPALGLPSGGMQPPMPIVR